MEPKLKKAIQSYNRAKKALSIKLGAKEPFDYIRFIDLEWSQTGPNQIEWDYNDKNKMFYEGAKFFGDPVESDGIKCFTLDDRDGVMIFDNEKMIDKGE